MHSMKGRKCVGLLKRSDVPLHVFDYYSEDKFNSSTVGLYIWKITDDSQFY